MESRFRWQEEPVVVVPMAIASIALCVVPFLVWGTNGAPAFFGSLIAALIAAGAVVGNAWLQRLENDRHRSEDIVLQSRRDALKLLGYMEQVASHLQTYVNFLNQCTYTVLPNVQPQDGDLTEYFDVKSIRSQIEPLLNIDLNRIFELSATAPHPLGLDVSSQLSTSIRIIKGSLVLSAYGDKAHPSRVVVEGAKLLASDRIKSMRVVETRLREALIKVETGLGPIR